MSQHKPDFKALAAQLRKPSGSGAQEVANGMDEVNGRIFDLTLEMMPLTQGQTILEIGFGSGTFIPKIFAKEEKIHLDGIDYSSEMVDRATAHNSDLIAAGKLTLRLGSSDLIPFSSGRFDIVYCNMVIFFWDNPATHLAEIHRVLKPGGLFFTGIRTKKTMQQFPFTQYGFSLYEPEDWKKVLEQNRFAVTEIKRRTDPTSVIDTVSITLESACIAARKID